ncbi:MAG: VWA domain-containing protein [Mogibacterium sp.]|nr:VWA domain-containing protein [Mogibacterium sp.]
MRRHNKNSTLIMRMLTLFLTMTLVLGSLSMTYADSEQVEPTEKEALATEQLSDEAKPEEGQLEEVKPEESVSEEGQPEEVVTEESKSETTFADLTPEAQYAALLVMSDEEMRNALATLSDEQIEALKDYINNLGPEYYPKTVVKTKAGPFKPAVNVAGNRRLKKALMRNTKANNNPDGLEMDKNLTDNGDGTYTITLESYTTGEITSQEISTPVDIVLVLDQSGSMAYDFNGNSSSYANSRQKAMKDAVQNFISTVHNKYSDSADHRISIVTFGSDASDLAGWTYVDDAGYATLNSLVGNLPQSPSGATNVAAGMGRATRLTGANPRDSEYNYDGPNTNRQKVVIVFTDGVPTTSTDFSTGVADGALNAAAMIKDAGVTIFTVGIFGGADPNELYGASGHTNNSNGNINSYWYDLRLFFFGDVQNADVPAGNRFLNYLSSNFGSIKQIGLSRTVFNIRLIEYIRYTITENNPRQASGYYLTANNADSLDDIFQSIAEQIATPTIDLGSSTVVKDIIAPQLQILEGATVKFYTQPYNGNNSWGTRTEVTDGSIHTVTGEDGNTVNVTGFDYNANCVTEEAKKDGTHGKKLIIEIIVEPGPNFLGGTIDTNGSNSGIYPDGTTTPIGAFPIPNNPFALKAIEPNNAKRNIYLSTEDRLAETFSGLKFMVGGNEVSFNDLFNGVNNAGVNYELLIKDGNDVKGTYRIPAGKTPSDEGSGWASIDGSAPVLPAGSYTIDSIVKDKNDSLTPVETVGRINLNVFEPTLTYADKNVYYKGNQINVDNVVPTEIVWKCGGKLDTEVDMDTIKPTLNYTYSGVTGTTVDQTGDYTIAVTAVKNGGVDLLTTYPDEVSFERDCTVEDLDGEEATADAAFKIHVYTPSYAFDDMSKYYGEEITLPSASDVTWKNGDNKAPSTMDNTKPTVEVTLTPTPATAFDNGYVQVKEDVPVKAVIKLGGADVTAALISAGKITRTCTPEICKTVPAATTDVAFVVHVKTVSLTVEKQIKGLMADKTAEYNFKVTITPAADSGITVPESTFVLGDNGTKTLDELPLGDFSVEEKDAKENYTVSFKINNGTDEVKDPAKVTGTLSEDNNGITTVVVTNKLDRIPITGIGDVSATMSLIVVLIALAGIALVVMSSRRRRIRNR